MTKRTKSGSSLPGAELPDEYRSHWDPTPEQARAARVTIWDAAARALGTSIETASPGNRARILIESELPLMLLGLDPSPPPKIVRHPMFRCRVPAPSNPEETP